MMVLDWGGWGGSAACPVEAASRGFRERASHVFQRVLSSRVSSRLLLLRTGPQDEADAMLDLGFKEQIYDVYRYLPPETQARRSLGLARGAS